MVRIHFLTEGLVSPNGRAFWFPLIVHRQALEDHGIRWESFTGVQDGLCDCDVLAIESKFYSRDWAGNTGKVLDQFASLRSRCSRILYFNIGDSSCWDHSRMLPFVDGYYASQVLKDRELYRKPLYGNRIFTDYYHRTFGIVDENAEYSEPIEDPSHLDKIGIGWNSGLADYSSWGPYWMGAYLKVPFPGFLRYPRTFVPPSVNRSRDISCRMGVSYARRTVSFQRLQIRERMKDILPTDKLSRRKYFEELCTSRIIISPFGLGEITLKDFEVFLTGGLLLKPDMSHMDTWPDFFRGGETMITHSWDLSDFDAVLDDLLANYSRYVDIIRAGQDCYRKYTSGPEAAGLFCGHFLEILNRGAP